MKIAIVSNGPSWREFLNRRDSENYDLVAAVTTRAAEIEADWWIFNDWKTFATVTPLGRPTILTSRIAHHKLYTRAPDHWDQYWKMGPPLLVEDVFEVFAPPKPDFAVKWSCYSGLSAFALGYWCSPDQIDFYGADMDGDLGADGGRNVSRTPKRWEHERRLWDGLADDLRSRGGVVRRIGTVMPVLQEIGATP